MTEYRKSSNKYVQKLLDDLLVVDEVKYQTIQLAREVVFDLYPKTSERIMYGGIMFSLKKEDWGGLFASKKHVSFEFSQGYQLKDPNNFLEGVGKFRRHLKLKTSTDVKNKNVEFFVQQLV